MDEAAYRRQVRYLRRYAHTADVPRDPYDVSARLTQRLLRYDRAVKLRSRRRIARR
jgi:hypothetical protein